MKKRYLLVFLAINAFINNPLSAQSDDNYSDILFMIVDGEYEKALNKSLKITDKDKTDREPLPYLYASMASYEMSKRDEFQADYPRAFRDAIKYAYKARRYDKEGTALLAQADYLNDLKAEVLREARFYFESGTWRRSATYAKYAVRIDPSDFGSLLLQGTAEARGRNTFQADKTFAEADEVFKGYKPESVSREMKQALLFSLLEYARLVENKTEKERAEKYLEKFSPLFAEDAEFQNFAEGYLL